MKKLKKYYATVETKALTEMTFAIRATNKKEANELLKKHFNYKKVISLKLTPPTIDRVLKNENAIPKNENLIYVKSHSKRKVFG